MPSTWLSYIWGLAIFVEWMMIDRSRHSYTVNYFMDLDLLVDPFLDLRILAKMLEVRSPIRSMEDCCGLQTEVEKANSHCCENHSIKK